MAADHSSDSGITFDDILDIVNPLQHLPVISTLYRSITGDQIKPFPKIAGDGLYGGWMGFASSIADTIFQKVTGKGFGDTALALVEDAFSPSSSSGQPTGLADASAPAGVTVADAAPVKPIQVAALAPLDTTATSVASNAPALPASVTPASLDSFVMPGQEALLSALSRSGLAPDTALRAVDAYRRTAGVTQAAAQADVQPPALRTSIME